MERTSAEVMCADGWRLAVDVAAPAEPRAAALVGHAMMVDKRTLERLVHRLVERGVAVVWPDLRGHGRSGPLAGDGGRWTYDDLVEQDTPALVGFARTLFPALPLTAVGHSLFGHVALARLGRHPETPLDAVVMLAGNIWGRRWEPDRLTALRKVAVMRVTAATARLVGYLPTRRMRMGTCDESEPYIRQLAGFVTRDDWSSADGFSYTAALQQIRRPLLAIAAVGDKLLCRPESGRRFAAEVPGAIFEVVGRHSGLATDGNHMALVTDERCRPVWDRVADFVLRQERR